VFLPKLVWFRLKCQDKLKQLILALAKDVKIKPGRLYFYYRGAQVNLESTVAQVRRTLLLLMASFALVLIAGVRQLSIPAKAKLDVEVKFDNALKG
jgi:predicted transport protein